MEKAVHFFKNLEPYFFQIFELGKILFDRTKFEFVFLNIFERV
jgi:hypothetical protein